MPQDNDEDGDVSYIDYETFLSPDFTPSAFANTLVLATNNPNDAPLDLSTPLSRVLFDIQEIDAHIDRLTTRSALPLLAHTQEQNQASTRIIDEIDPQIASLNDSYKQLEKEVIQKHAEADQVRQVASRLWETLWLGRAVSRALQLGRQLEVQHAELTGASTSASSTGPGVAGATTATSSSPTIGTASSSLPASTSNITSIAPRKEDHRALVRCAHTILSLHDLLDPRQIAPGASSEEMLHRSLSRIAVLQALQDNLLNPTERTVRDTAERLVREFALPSTLTFTQTEETKSRTVSALTTLYLLSPLPSATTSTTGASSKSERNWVPTLMLHALEAYLRTALQSSLAALARSLAQLPTLERTLAEVSARCQNVVALEAVLEGTRAPVHPLLLSSTTSTSSASASTAADAATVSAAAAEATTNAKPAAATQTTLLQPLLAHLETGSLASYFWRTMAGGLATRVQEIVVRGGVAARTLRTNRAAVADAIRECVVRGSQLPSGVAAAAGAGAGAKSGKGKKGRRERDEEDGSGEGDAGTRWEREVAVMVGSVVGALSR